MIWIQTKSYVLPAKYSGAAIYPDVSVYRLPYSPLQFWETTQTLILSHSHPCNPKAEHHKREETRRPLSLDCPVSQTCREPLRRRPPGFRNGASCPSDDAKYSWCLKTGNQLIYKWWLEVSRKQTNKQKRLWSPLGIEPPTLKSWSDQLIHSANDSLFRVCISLRTTISLCEGYWPTEKSGASRSRW